MSAPNARYFVLRLKVFTRSPLPYRVSAKAEYGKRRAYRGK